MADKSKKIRMITFKCPLNMPTGEPARFVYSAQMQLALDPGRKYFTINGSEYPYDQIMRVDFDE